MGKYFGVFMVLCFIAPAAITVGFLISETSQAVANACFVLCFAASMAVLGWSVWCVRDYPAQACVGFFVIALVVVLLGGVPALMKLRNRHPHKRSDSMMWTEPKRPTRILSAGGGCFPLSARSANR